jgi:hypothetical protein
MTKTEFEPVDRLHQNWENHVKLHGIDEDMKALYKLVESNTGIARNETEVLATVYDSALVILDSTPQLDDEQKTRASYFSYNLCSCESCQTCGAHINKKGQIRVSQKYFLDTLNQTTSPAIGVLELMYTILHELLHGIFPELDETEITQKTEQVWLNGMAELITQK